MADKKHDKTQFTFDDKEHLNDIQETTEINTDVIHDDVTQKGILELSDKPAEEISAEEKSENDEHEESLPEDESSVDRKKVFVCPFKRKFKTCSVKTDEILEKILLKIGISKKDFFKTLHFKVLVIALLSCFVGIFFMKSVYYHNLNNEEIPKYVVDQFITQLRLNTEQVNNGGKNIFPNGKRVQIYGPVVRIKNKVVYMKSEDCILEITMSSKKEIPYVILGKQYKIEATISDVSGVDEEIYLKKGVFLEPIPSSVR